MQVPIKQKTRAYAPQTKLEELLVGIMSGLEHLADLSDGPLPLVKDAIVAHGVQLAVRRDNLCRMEMPIISTSGLAAARLSSIVF